MPDSKGSKCISATHSITAKCKSYIHFRLDIYAKGTWLNCTIQDHKPCVDGIYVESKMIVPFIFCNHGMGGRIALAYCNYNRLIKVQKLFF